MVRNETESKAKKNTEFPISLDKFFAVWTGLYMIPIFGGFNTLKEILQKETMQVSNSMLSVFGLALTIYFWYFDTLYPGFKVRYPASTPKSFISAFAVVSALFGLFLVIDYPTLFLLVTSGVYVFKAVWHHFSMKVVTIEKHKSLLHLAILSDCVTASILFIYWLINFVLQWVLYQHIVVEAPYGLCWFIIGVVVALEVHYQCLRRHFEKFY